MASHGISGTVMVPQDGILIVSANKARKKVILQNINGAGAVTIKLDSVPANDDDGLRLDPGTMEHIELEVTNAIYGKANQVGGDTVAFIEIFE